MSLEDSVIEQVRSKLLERSRVGISKYGVTLDRTDFSFIRWLEELQAELLDGAGYIQKIINELEAKNEKD